MIVVNMISCPSIVGRLPTWWLWSYHFLPDYYYILTQITIVNIQIRTIFIIYIFNLLSEIYQLFLCKIRIIFFHLFHVMQYSLFVLHPDNLYVSQFVGQSVGQHHHSKQPNTHKDAILQQSIFFILLLHFWDIKWSTLWMPIFDMQR